MTHLNPLSASATPSIIPLATTPPSSTKLFEVGENRIAMSDSVSSEEDAPLTLEERVELLMLAPLEDTILEEVANVLVRDGKAVALTFATWVIDRHPKSEFRETTAARSVAGRIGKLFEEQHPEEKNLLARNFAAIVLTRLGSGKRSFTPLL